jgi:lipopolysaccharide export system protein LptC
VKYHVAVIVLAVVGLGCNNVIAPNPDNKEVNPAFPVGPVPTGKVSDDQLDMVGHGVDLRLFDTDPTTGAPRKPNFWIHAEIFSVADKDIWSFEKARAVIYGKNEGDQEIHLEAGEGKFQESKMAYLKGGVKGTVGDMKLEMTDIEWLNDENMAKSDNPVSIKNGDSRLQAASMRLYPKDKQLLLTNVTGLVSFERKAP